MAARSAVATDVPQLAEALVTHLADCLRDASATNRARTRAAIGRRVREQLESCGVTQRQIAERAGVSYSSVSHAIAGRRAFPPSAVWALRELGIDPDTGKATAKRKPARTREGKAGVRAQSTSSAGGDE